MALPSLHPFSLVGGTALNVHTKDIVGKIKITEAIRPGVINFYLGFGHWATGAGDVNIDGNTIEGDCLIYKHLFSVVN